MTKRPNESAMDADDAIEINNYDSDNVPISDHDRPFYAGMKNASDEINTKIIRYLPQSRAQLRQDIFTLCQGGFKHGGFFVEFGATDGMSLSNSYLLEDQFGWNGILAEPGRCWHEALRKNRRCAVETSCVWEATGERLVFRQFDQAPEYSTIAAFEPSDFNNRISAEISSSYDVETISLLDLLAKFDAPKAIDYLSIDTEGSELRILEAFDFSLYDIEVITVEHNFLPTRRDLRKLLEKHGYERRFVELSKWDDWYVKRA